MNVLDLPAYPFDVIVDLDAQLGTATAAAAGKHFAAIRSGHALTETVHTHSAANFRLISSFCSHFSSLQTVINILKRHRPFVERHSIITHKFLETGLIVPKDGLILPYWDADRKGCSLSFFTLKPYFSVMTGYDRFDDGKA